MRDKQRGQADLEKRVDRVERRGGRAAAERNELGGLVESYESVGHRMWRVADRRRGSVREELTLRRKQQMDEGRGKWPQEPEQHALKPAADPAELEQRCGEHDDGRLYHDVAMPHVCEFVRQHCLELRRGCGRQQPCADRERGAARPATRGERTGKTVVHQVQPRLCDAGACREALDRGVEPRCSPYWELARADEAESDSVRVPVGRAGKENPEEDEDGGESLA